MVAKYHHCRWLYLLYCITKLLRDGIGVLLDRGFCCCSIPQAICEISLLPDTVQVRSSLPMMPLSPFVTGAHSVNVKERKSVEEKEGEKEMAAVRP
jgi:hypothetical protein